MKKAFFLLIACMPLWSMAQVLTNSTTLTITKTWSQEPAGYTYPIGIRVPPGPPPQGGFPVCILLHGNTGNGMAMIGQFANILQCHALVAPTGYQNSWNICAENSDAPDVEMVTELVDLVQGYTNIDPNRIRILGSSNGGGLANRIFIENSDPGIDRICAIVTQLHEPQYHNNGFYQPGSVTTPGNPYCGYADAASPLTSRKYLSICNLNDSIIPYLGGTSVVGVDFLPAEEAAFILAQHKGFTGSQLTSGTPMGNPSILEFSYLSGQVVHLSGNAAHGTNTTQRDYITDFFDDCSPLVGRDAPGSQTVKVYPNPVAALVSVERQASVSTPYFLANPQGQVVMSGSTTAKTLRLNLSDLPPNTYFLKIDGRTLQLVRQ